MRRYYEEDPVLPPQLVEAINERCDISFYLGRHSTAEEAEVAAEFCRPGHLVLPEMIGWDTDAELGANALAQQGLSQRRYSYQEREAMRQLLKGQKSSHPDYGGAFYRGLSGCGALVRFVDPPVGDHPDYLTLNGLVAATEYDRHGEIVPLDEIQRHSFERACL